MSSTNQLGRIFRVVWEETTSRISGSYSCEEWFVTTSDRIGNQVEDEAIAKYQEMRAKSASARLEEGTIEWRTALG